MSEAGNNEDFGGPDWLEGRTRVTTVGQLRQAISALADSFQMPLFGTYDGGFGIGRDVSVGTQVTNGVRSFVIDVEDD